MPSIAELVDGVGEVAKGLSKELNFHALTSIARAIAAADAQCFYEIATAETNTMWTCIAGVFGRDCRGVRKTS